MKLCRDCDHVDRATARLSEDYVICNRPVECDTYTYTSPVTGESVRRTIPLLNCKYERALGECSEEAIFFKPKG